MTKEEAIMCNSPCREKMTIDSSISQCEWNIRKSAEEETFAKGKVEAYVTMLNMLNLLKQDLESDNK